MPDTPATPDAVSAVVITAGGHPQRTMLLAHHLYDLLDDGAAADVDLAAEALRRSLAELADVFEATWASLSRAERAVVTALADGRSPYSQQTATEHAISRSTLQHATDRLADRGQLVTRDDDGPRLLDPLLAEWLRQR